MTRNKRERLRLSMGDGVAKAYSSWSEMRRRIRHPLRKGNGSNYVGLTIQPEWEDFNRFLSDMGPCPNGMSLDRIDSSMGYSSINCRWADARTQARNRPYCRLNEQKASEIRERYAKGDISEQALADEYGCSQLLVSKVIHRDVWA